MPKAAVIIGAGAGVGRATALEFARNGCDVGLLPREPNRLEEAAAECRMPGPRGDRPCPNGPRLPIRAMQSIYCGAKFAIRGFLKALRSELYHDRIATTPTEVDLPAINTPQFDWARNKTGRKAQPLPPVFQPEVAARAI